MPTGRHIAEQPTRATDRPVQAGPLQLYAASLGAHGIFFALAISYLIIFALIEQAFPHLNWGSAASAMGLVIASVAMHLLALSCYLAVEIAIYVRPKHPLLQLLKSMKDTLSTPRVLAAGLPVFISLLIFTYAFANLKGNIPALMPFVWDTTLDRWDAALHFGRRPWEWLQPILGRWPVTLVLNVLYNLWFIVMLVVWLRHACFKPPGVRRTRFLLAFMLLWMIAGGLFAVGLSSAGPCFFGAGRLGHVPDPYAGLMAYLRQANEIVPIWAVPLQDMMWSLHSRGSIEGDISAMPSLHNATTLLFFLASSGWPRWVRCALGAYVPVIFVGSVHLGWHYAVDSYVGWALTLAIWWLAEPLARWWEATPAARRYREAYAAA